MNVKKLAKILHKAEMEDNCKDHSFAVYDGDVSVEIKCINPGCARFLLCCDAEYFAEEQNDTGKSA